MTLLRRAWSKIPDVRSRKTNAPFLLFAAFCLFSTCAWSQMRTAPSTIKQTWTAGWDNLLEPLNFTQSNITWSVNATTRKLTINFKLVGATPSKLYQVGIHIFCNTFPATFGQRLPMNQSGTRWVAHRTVQDNRKCDPTTPDKKTTTKTTE